MNNVQIFSNKQDIHLQACEWISRLDRGLSKCEKQEFANWVTIGETHRKILFEVAKTWDDLSVLHELSGLFPLKNKHVRQRKVFSHRTRLTIAASFAFMVISCFVLLINTQLMSSIGDASLVMRDVETSVGEHRIIPLADGSVIHLNTDSLVSVNFSDTHRHINLHRGEAHFEVAHDEMRPFIVKAADNTVTAVGTAFNVQVTSAKDFELLVTDGKVLVKNKQHIDVVSTSLTNANNPQKTNALNGVGELMVAGQKAFISQQSIQQLFLSDEQIQSDLAWQQGMLVFHGEPLAEALQEISRYTSINFVLADEKVKQRRVAGYFKAGDIQGLLFALENNFNIVYSKRVDQTIVLSSGL